MSRKSQGLPIPHGDTSKQGSQDEQRIFKVEIPEKLAHVLFQPMRYKVFVGGRGSSKSWSIARALIVRAMSQQTRWLCCREFQTSMRESVHFLLSSQIQMLGCSDRFEIQKDRILGPNGSEFAFLGLHDKNLDSLKSYEGFDGVWLEEGQSVTARSLQFLKPTIRKAGSEIWITMNPESPEDPVYADFVQNPPANASVVIVNWYDNPWFNEVLRAEKDADYARDPELASWIWGGECRRNSLKQVLRRCEQRPFTPTDLWDGPYQGQDFGFGQDPMAMVRCWIWEGDLYVEYEASGEHVEIEDHAALMDTIPNAREFITRADNSRPEIISYLKRNGYPRITDCRKWSGCVEDRVLFLQSFHRIIIHPRCPRAWQESKAWSWRTNKAGDILNVLQPGHDHCWDAVGYALEPHILGFSKKNTGKVEPLLDSWGHPIKGNYNRTGLNPNSWLA